MGVDKGDIFSFMDNMGLFGVFVFISSWLGGMSSFNSMADCHAKFSRNSCKLKPSFLSFWRIIVFTSGFTLNDNVGLFRLYFSFLLRMRCLSSLVSISIIRVNPKFKNGEGRNDRVY